MVGRIFERLRMFFREVAFCLKEGRECHSILPKVEEMWDQPLENLKKIENPCEIDESESDKNEMVIFDE